MSSKKTAIDGRNRPRCPKCGNCTRILYYRKISETTTPIRSKIYLCDSCGIVFERNLAPKMSLIGSAKMITCNKCSNVFTELSNLYKIMIEGELYYYIRCPKCFKIWGHLFSTEPLSTVDDTHMEVESDGESKQNTDKFKSTNQSKTIDSD